MLIEIIKFLIYSILIVMISKYMLVKALRKLAENLKLKPRTIGNIAGIATSIPELLTVTISSFRGLMGTSVYNIISSNLINFTQYSVSLIVNNEGTYTAAITRKVKATKTITENFSYPTFEDEEVTDTKTYTVESEELEWFYLKIEFERSGSSFQEELKARLEEIK